MTFDHSPDADLKFFLFFFENVAQPSKQNDEIEKTFIFHLTGEAFRFFYKQSTVNAKLTKEGRSY